MPTEHQNVYKLHSRRLNELFNHGNSINCHIMVKSLDFIFSYYRGPQAYTNAGRQKANVINILMQPKYT